MSRDDLSGGDFERCKQTLWCRAASDQALAGLYALPLCNFR